jgi:hypothetical protein
LTPAPNEASASKLNRELTRLLAEAGARLGLEVVLEYPVKGGRLDVAWVWSPTDPIPGLERPVPVAGFEIESSWRTRKHVKGDLLNLQDAGVALGVIVLAGSSEKDESLRRFAEILVDRPGPQILIWSADDVRALADRSVRHAAQAPAARTEPAASTVAGVAIGDSLVANHTGKYAALYRWLLAQDSDSVTATFNELEEIIGFPLPNSCRDHVPHWHSYDGSAVARAIIAAGWKARRVRLPEQTVTLVRSRV